MNILANCVQNVVRKSSYTPLEKVVCSDLKWHAQLTERITLIYDGNLCCFGSVSIIILSTVSITRSYL